MSWCDAATLKSFVSDNSILTRTTSPDGLAEAILQADSIINIYTGEPVPDSPAKGHAILRNIACSLVIWFTAGMLSDQSEQEISRLKKLYDSAMELLTKIKNGELSLDPPESDDDYVPPKIYSTRRIDEMF